MRPFLLLLSFFSLSFPTLAQWQRVDGGLPADFSAEDVFVAANGMVFTTGTGGIYRSDDNGTTFSLENNNLGTLFGGDPGPFRIVSYPELTLVGTNGKSGLYYSLDRGENWSAPANLPTEGAGFYDFIQVDADTYLATKRENVVGDSGVWVSFDRGVTWERRSEGLVPIAYIPGFGGIIPVEAVAVDGINWYAAVNGKGVFRSRNEGLSWQAINEGITIGATVAGAIAETSDVVAHDGRVMAIVDQNLYVSDDGGDSWSRRAAHFGYQFGDIDVRDGLWFISALGPDRRVFVTEDGQTFRTTVGTSEALWARADPISVANDAIYVADGVGLWRLDFDEADLLDLPPVITDLQGGGVFFSDSTVTLNVAADGTGPLSYQWYHDGSPIPGATAPSLTLMNTLPEDTGDYTVIVSGPGGSLESSPLAVEILDAVPGVPDPSYNFFGAYSRLSSSYHGFLVMLYEAVVQSDGHVWVAGEFDRSTGLDGTTASDNIALKRLAPDGTVATIPTLSYEAVYALALDADDRLIAGSYRGKVVRYAADGSLEGVIALAKNGTSDGELYEVLLLPDGRFFVAGDFDRITDSDGNNAVLVNDVALLNADGTVDPGFNPGSGTSGTIYRLAWDDERQLLYVGGSFSGWDGANSHRSLVRLQADGSHDTTFLLNGGNSNSVTVRALMLQADGRAVIGTQWDHLGRRLERLLDDGSVDPSFNPGGAGPNAPVWNLAQNVDGTFYATGEFALYNGEAKNFLVALEQDGTINEAFNPGGTGPLNNASEAAALALSPDGAYLYLGMDGYSYRTGEETVTFSRLGFPTDAFIRLSNPVTNLAIVRHPDDETIDAGQTAMFSVEAFSSTAASYQWRLDGQPIAGANADTLEIPNAQEADEGVYDVVISNAGGSVVSEGAVLLTLAEPKFVFVPGSQEAAISEDLTLAVEAVGQGDLTYQWYKDGDAIAGATEAALVLDGLSPDDAGLYYVVVSNDLGDATSAPIPVTAEIVGGAPDTAFTTGLPEDSPLGGSDLLTLPDGGILVAGGPDNLTRVGPDGTPDPSWPGTGLPDGDVRVLRAQDDGRIIVGGAFFSFGGDSSLRALARLNSDGTVDDSFTPPALAGIVFDVELLPDGKLLVGGSFASVEGVNYGYLVRLHSDGTLDPSFHADGTGLNQRVHALEVDDAGRIILAGTFTSWDGSSSGNLIRLLADGSLDGTFNNDQLTNGGNGHVVQDLRLLADGRLILVGSFNNFGGVSGASKAVLLGPDGEIDPTFPLNPTQDSLRGVRQLVDGSLVFFGSFDDWLGETVRGMVVSNLDGSLSSGFAERFNPQTANFQFPSFSAVDTSTLGHALVAGSFATINGHSSPGLAKVYFDPIGLAITAQPANQFLEAGATATFSVDAVGTSTPVYQWFKDGQRIAGADSATLELTDAGPADVGTYTVRVFNAAGNLFSDSALLRILGAPEVITPPESVVLSAGRSAVLSAEVIGLPTLAYQWQRDGLDLPGETASTLALAQVGVDEAGLYSLRVTNAEGSVTTGPAGVSVAFANGGVDGAFDIGLDGSNGSVAAVLPQTDGFVLLITPNQLSGAPDESLARVLPDGSVDSTFDPAFPAEMSSLDGLWQRPDGRFIAGGNFGYIDTVEYKTRYLTILDATGAQSSLTVESSSFSPRNVHVFADNRFLVHGAIEGGNTYTIRRYNADGSLDDTYTSPVANGRIDHAAFAADGSAVIAGLFTQVNGVDRTHLAVLEPDGTLRDSFAPTASIVGSGIRTVALDEQGRVYLGGGSNVVAGRYLARFLADGSLDDGFGPVPIGGSSTLYARIDVLRLLPSGKLLVGGYRFHFHTDTLANGGEPYSWNLARLLSDGSVDTDYELGGGLTEYENVRGLAVLPSGGFYVWGNFSAIGGEAIATLARVNGDAAPRTVVGRSGDLAEPEEGSTVRLVAAAYGVGPLAFQWYRNGVALLGETVPTLVIDNFSALDLGQYRLALTDAEGTTLSEPIAVTSTTLGDTFASFVADFPEALQGPGDDGNGNGWPNLWDYAFGSDLTSSWVLPYLTVATGDELGLAGDPKHYLVITYRQRATAADLTVMPRAATDFDGLATGNAHVQPVGTPLAEGATVIYFYRSTLALEDHDAVLMDVFIDTGS